MLEIERALQMIYYDVFLQFPLKAGKKKRYCGMVI